MKRSLLIKLHLYAGLFTSFYLIVFGFSTLKMNHDLNTDKNTITKVWEKQITIDTSLSDKILAGEIRDEIGLMGWTPKWKFQRDSISFKFYIQRMGKNYSLNANTQTGLVEVSEIPKGFLSVLNGLHFFNGNMPNSTLFLRSWIIYQWLSLFVMAISVILGLWLWLKYSYKPWHGYTFGLLFVATIILMMVI